MGRLVSKRSQREDFQFLTIFFFQRRRIHNLLNRPAAPTSQVDSSPTAFWAAPPSGLRGSLEAASQLQSRMGHVGVRVLPPLAAAPVVLRSSTGDHPHGRRVDPALVPRPDDSEDTQVHQGAQAHRRPPLTDL